MLVNVLNEIVLMLIIMLVNVLNEIALMLIIMLVNVLNEVALMLIIMLVNIRAISFKTLTKCDNQHKGYFI
jgi:hypothetical protein